MKLFNKYIMGSLLLGTAALGFTSCDLEEYNPSGETADEVFATQQGMENLVNQMYYNFRWKYYGREDPVLYMEGSADIWQNIGNNYEYGMQMTRCVNLEGDRGQIANVWNRVYDNINDANAIINRIEDVNWEPTAADALKKSDFEGEARFMRSYCYWWLVEFFGDIEMRTQETKSAEFSAVRTDRKVIYDEVIIPDAQKAADLLPVKEYNGNVGRSTKKSAKALLARVLLTRAQYETAGSAEQKAFYEKALAAANDVINNMNSLGITLYSSYDDIWKARNNKNNTEFLWVTSFSSNSALDADSKPNRLYRYFAPRLVDNAGIKTGESVWEYPSEGRLMMPSYYFLKLWKDWDARYDAIFQEEFPLSTDAKGKNQTYQWSAAMAKRWYPQKYEDSGLSSQPYIDDDGEPDTRFAIVKTGDIVLRYTKESVSPEEEFEAGTKGCCVVDIDRVFKTEAVNAMGGAPLRNYNTNYPDVDPSSTEYIVTSFPRFMKYRIWDKDQPDGPKLLAAANGQFGYADVPVIRFAEMPLIAAECYIALGQQQQAADVIKKWIRNERVVKAGHTLAEVQADVTAGNMTIDWIMEERARELCGEWLRWFDCKRIYGPQGKFASTIVGRNPSMRGDDDSRQEFHTLWPIPNTFLDKLTNPEEFGQNPGYTPYTKK